MKVDSFKNRQDALDSLGAEKDLAYVRHVMRPGDGGGEDIHPFNEFIIADHGKFSLTIGEETRRFDLYGNSDRAVLIFVPACVKHSFRALGQISYWVVEEKITHIDPDGGNLGFLEDCIREKARHHKELGDLCRAEESNLMQLIEQYKKERDRAQREIWEKNGKAWCRKCRRFYERKDTVLVFSVCQSRYEEDRLPYHPKNSLRPYRYELQAFCPECGKKMLSSHVIREFETIVRHPARIISPDEYEFLAEGKWQKIGLGEQTKLDVDGKMDEPIHDREYEVGVDFNVDHKFPVIGPVIVMASGEQIN